MFLYTYTKHFYLGVYRHFPEASMLIFASRVEAKIYVKVKGIYLNWVCIARGSTMHYCSSACLIIRAYSRSELFNPNFKIFKVWHVAWIFLKCFEFWKIWLIFPTNNRLPKCFFKLWLGCCSNFTTHLSWDLEFVVYDFVNNPVF